MHGIAFLFNEPTTTKRRSLLLELAAAAMLRVPTKPTLITPTLKCNELKLLLLVFVVAFQKSLARLNFRLFFFTVPRILEIVCFFKFYLNVSHQFFVSSLCLVSLCYATMNTFSCFQSCVLWPLSSSSSKKRKMQWFFHFQQKLPLLPLRRVCLAVQFFHYQDSSDSWWWFTCCCCPYTILNKMSIKKQLNLKNSR